MTARLSSSTSKLVSFDYPNERSLHTEPVPRTGGIAIMVSLLAGVVGALVILPADHVYDSAILGVLGGMAVIALLSLWDDRVGLPAAGRFVAQAVVAGGVIWGGGLSVKSLELPFLGIFPLGWLALPLSILFLMWMTNLYNFMDGMDGFAGGMTVIGFGCLGYLGWLGGYRSFFIISLLITAATAGFLVKNFPPAKIFMGDVGSAPLGFLAGGLAILGEHKGLYELWVPLLIFSPFIVDATATLIRRLFQRKKIWQAHREHHYQRLVLAGWSHRQTILTEYLLMLACGLSALIFSRLGEIWRLIILTVWGAVYGLLSRSVRRVERKDRSARII